MSDNPGGWVGTCPRPPPGRAVPAVSSPAGRAAPLNPPPARARRWYCPRKRAASVSDQCNARCLKCSACVVRMHQKFHGLTTRFGISAINAFYGDRERAVFDSSYPALFFQIPDMKL